MTTLLQINTSARRDGNANRLANQFSTHWLASHPDGRVIVRDLAAEPLPHLDETILGAFFTPAEARTPEQAAVAARSEALIAEVEAADSIVIAAPLYNFGIPSTLKAWFDQLARVGISFRYGANGPVGLLRNKKVVVISARGGVSQGTPADSQTAYLRTMLNFIGLHAVEFIHAEGLNMGDDAKAAAEHAAANRMQQLAIA